jgi:hypothetical protein
LREKVADSGTVAVARSVWGAVLTAVCHPAFPEVIGRDGGGNAEEDEGDESSFHGRTGLNNRVAQPKAAYDAGPT